METIPDIVAFSGQRDYTVIDAGFDRVTFTEQYVESLLRGGWYKIAGPISQSRGPGYIMQSQQSPWYEGDETPHWYRGNVMEMDINNTHPTDVTFNISAQYAGGRELTSGNFFFRPNNFTGYNLTFLNCPYQTVFWTNKIPNHVDDWMGAFMASALQIPKVVLQRNRTIHCIHATQRLRNVNSMLSGSFNFGPDYSCYRTFERDEEQVIVDNGVSAYGQQNNLRFIGPVSSVGTGHRSGRRIWYRQFDENMSSPETWLPFFTPAYAIWRLPGSTKYTINGFFWDALVLSEGCLPGTEILVTANVGQKQFICFAGTWLSGNERTGQSLFFNNDPLILEDE